MDNRVIDVAIGLCFAFLLVSVLVSAVQEFVAGLLKSRSLQLEKGIKCLLSGYAEPQDAAMRKFITDVFAHPLVFNLADGGRLPSYLPAANFSKAVLDVAARQAQAAGTLVQDARGLIEAANSGPWRELLSPLVTEAGGDVSLFRKKLEEQYDHMMDRVSGWYKRRAQWFMLFYGFVIAAVLNVDAGQLAGRLWRDDALRAAVVSSATHLPAEAKSDQAALEAEVLKQAGTGALPVSGLPQVPEGFVTSLVGWLITAVAASLGAPFWFDAMGKFVQVRSAGAKPPRSTDVPAEDPARPPASGTTPARAAVSPADERNAIVELHAQRNKEDASYRPVLNEERWS